MQYTWKLSVVFTSQTSSVATFMENVLPPGNRYSKLAGLLLQKFLAFKYDATITITSFP